MSYRNKLFALPEPKEKEPYPWILREKEYRRLLAEYMQSFKFTNLWMDAEKYGYSVPLYAYVYSVAATQADMIVGNHVGYGACIFDNFPSDGEKKVFLDEQKRQASMGFISVAVPTGKIAFWLKIAEIRIAENAKKAAA